jgi:hypothetical protein
MTTTDDRPAVTITCPSWCAGPEEGPGRGEHMDDKTFVPATGASRPSSLTVEQGAAFPVLGVGLDWSELDGAAGPSVVLWATGVDGVDGVDGELYLQPREARQLVEAVQARLAVLGVRS